MDRQLAREHLDRQLGLLRDAPMRPPRGWVRAIRDALGMSSSELGDRLGIAQPSVVDLEQAEATDSITLERLRRAADALGCDLRYALVPRQSLQETVRGRALSKARSQLARVDHHGRLEDQELSADEFDAEVERLARRLIDRRGLWS